MRTGSEVQFKSAGPHNDGPLAVNDDSRAWSLVQPHKLAHVRDNI